MFVSVSDPCAVLLFIHIFSPHARPQIFILHDMHAGQMVELRGQELLSLLTVKTLLWVIELATQHKNPEDRIPQIIE